MHFLIFFLIIPFKLIKYNTVNMALVKYLEEMKLLLKHSFSLLIVFKLLFVACAAVGVAFVLYR